MGGGDWWAFQDNVRIDFSGYADCRRYGKFMSIDGHVVLRISSTLLKPATCALLGAFAVFGSSIPAEAAIIVNAFQSGADVVFSYSGSLNVGSSLTTSSGDSSKVTPSLAAPNAAGCISSMCSQFRSLGGVSFGEAPVTWSNVSGTFGNVFGSSTTARTPTSVTGGPFGFARSQIYAPVGYTSGSSLSGSYIFANLLLSDFGMTTSSTFSATYTINGTSTSDIITVNGTTDPAGVPAPLPILGLPAVLFYSRKLKKRIKASREASIK